jgi:hypothetical protein
MYMLLGVLCWGFYYFGGHVTAWIIAGAVCILAEGFSYLAEEMKERGKNHDAVIKKCVDDYCATLKEINTKNTLNTVYGVGCINGFSVTPCSSVSESVDSPDVDRL